MLIVQISLIGKPRFTLTAALSSVVLYLWGSPVGFSGSGISLIWISGFGILKQKPGEIWNWKYHGRWDAQKKKNRDYRIAWNSGSTLGVWRILLGTLYLPQKRRTRRVEKCGLIAWTAAGNPTHTNLILASLVLTSDCLFCDEFNHLKVTFKNYILGLHLILVLNLASVGLEKTAIPSRPWPNVFPFCLHEVIKCMSLFMI